MKKVWNFIYKYRIVIVIFFMLILGVFGFIVIKSYIYPEDARTVYGSRLNGIDDISITNETKQRVETNIKNDEEVTSASVSLQGKIINISIVKVVKDKNENNEVATKENTKEAVEELSKKILEDFTEEEIMFYDFQIFINNKDANYNMIGYKSNKSEKFSWVFDNIVKEVEEDEKEEE